MNLFDSATKKTIDSHCRDFTVSNYKTKIQKAGGFDKYFVSLGGIFALFHPMMGKTATTIQRFRLGAQFIFGAMNIYGIDYSNGNGDGAHYYRWGCGSGAKAAVDAFRKSGKGKCKGGRLKTILDNPDIVTTCCNYGVDTLLRELGLYKTASCNFISWATKYGTPVKNKKDLREGDMVSFFNSPVNRAKPSTWKGKGWKHIAIVYAIEGGKIWLLDFGSRYIKSKNPLHSMPIDNSDKAGGEYSGYWAAVHAFTLLDWPFEGKTDDQLAVEVIADKHGSGDARKKALGDRFKSVQERVNALLKDHDAYIRACADYVLAGYAGTGEERKQFFSSIYDEVQAKVDWTINTAKAVINKEYGNGDERKEKLGADFDLVQAEVNRILKG